MSEFFGFLKVLILTGAGFGAFTLILLALPKSRLTSLALEFSKYAGAGLCVILLPLPIDVIPDVIPVVGWADDIAYVVGAWTAVSSGLGDRKQRRFEQACENARLAREAGLDAAEFGVEDAR